MTNLTRANEIIDEFVTEFTSNPGYIWVTPFEQIFGVFFTSAVVVMGALLFYGTTKKWQVLVPYFIFVNIFLSRVIEVHFLIVIMIFTFIFTGALIYLIFIQRRGTRL